MNNPSDFHYVMMNKPRGFVTACKDEANRTVTEFLPENLRDMLRPIGRLDKDTEGLLLFTDDGHFNQFLTRPESHMPKTYFFWALGELTEEKKKALEQGVSLRGCDFLTAPAVLEIREHAELSSIQTLLNPEAQPGILKNPANNRVVSGLLTITEGRKHQVKRMLKAVGCYVVYLKRISIGEVALDESLKPGQCRELYREEWEKLCSTSNT